MSEIKTGTSRDVLEYYSKNFQSILNCYSLGDDGFPVDPAYYRRRLYNKFLNDNRPSKILDIGCGGGYTVLDALNLGLDAYGIEPVDALVANGKKILRENNQSEDRICKDDLANIVNYKERYDLVSLLSVLPHVPESLWESAHRDIAGLISSDGVYFGVYRNALFDLYTFNSFTIDFYLENLLADVDFSEDKSGVQLRLRELISFPDIPGREHTNARDKNFGKLERVKSNPLTIGKYLKSFRLDVEKIQYYHFHCLPPIAMNKMNDYKGTNHKMELSMSDSWQGAFMAAMFIVQARKV